jgi:hypothetical protein
MTEYIRNEIRTELEAEFSGEINKTVYYILEAEGLPEALALRNAHIESVYRQINQGGARIVLSFWNPASRMWKNLFITEAFQPERSQMLPYINTKYICYGAFSSDVFTEKLTLLQEFL